MRNSSVDPPNCKRLPMTDTDTAGYQAAFEQVQRLLNAGAFEQALEQVDLILASSPTGRSKALMPGR